MKAHTKTAVAYTPNDKLKVRSIAVKHPKIVNNAGIHKAFSSRRLVTSGLKSERKVFIIAAKDQ